MEDATKIRKRGCSPSSSTTSSVMQGYKFKRAILVGKRGGGMGSSTPVPTWRMVGSRSPSLILRAAAASPRYPPSLSGRSRSGQGQGQGQGQPPVSARKLGATLWELNELPSPSPSPSPRLPVKAAEERVWRREKLKRSVNSSSLPPHLSDPSHSPTASEKMERSGTGGHRRRGSSMSRRTKADNYDSRSNASFMEIETRSRCQTTSGSTVVGVKTRLKDVSNALTTSKELVKIISRMWNPDDQPSTSMSLISALHSELERARLQINQLIQEERSDNKEISYLLKRFSEEKAAWKSKEQEAVEAAVDTITAELEVERKLRKRFESLNKKLGKELAETKAALHKSMKELELEKTANGGEEEEEDCTDEGGNSGESDLHSIDLRTQNEELRERKSSANQVARRSAMLRSVSNVLEWGNGRNFEIDEQVPRRSCGNDIRRHTSAKGSKLVFEGELVSSFSQQGEPWPSRDPYDGAVQGPTILMGGSGMRGRVEEGIDEGYYKVRRSRR